MDDTMNIVDAYRRLRTIDKKVMFLDELDLVSVKKLLRYKIKRLCEKVENSVVTEDSPKGSITYSDLSGAEIKRIEDDIDPIIDRVGVRRAKTYADTLVYNYEKPVQDTVLNFFNNKIVEETRLLASQQMSFSRKGSRKGSRSSTRRRSTRRRSTRRRSTRRRSTRRRSTRRSRNRSRRRSR